MSTAAKLRTACNRIAPPEGTVINLYGVREVLYEENGGVRIVFCPGGGPGKPVREKDWIPTVEAS